MQYGSQRSWGASFKGFCGGWWRRHRLVSLLRQERVPVGLHLLQALHQVAVGHLHLLDLVQSRAQLRERESEEGMRGRRRRGVASRTAFGKRPSSLGAVTSLWSFLFSAFSSSSTFSELSADVLYLETWPSSLLIWKAERKAAGFDGRTW